MDNKKYRLFLLISFMFFVLSVIAVISSIFIPYYKIKSDFPNDARKIMVEVGFGLAMAFLLIPPFWGSELSFIRSIYKILKHTPRKRIKICYIISSCLSLFAISFFLLASLGLINFTENNGNDHTVEILILTLWPSFILSFILGSIPQKRIK